MKSIYKFIALFFALVTLSLTGCSSDEKEKDSATGLDSVGSISDADVKACFDAVNAFRTGSEAFYTNADNSTKTFLVGQLSALAFDEKLAQAAKIRAEEISSSFEHTRPGGMLNNIAGKFLTTRNQQIILDKEIMKYWGCPKSSKMSPRAWSRGL